MMPKDWHCRAFVVEQRSCLELELLEVQLKKSWLLLKRVKGEGSREEDVSSSWRYFFCGKREIGRCGLGFSRVRKRSFIKMIHFLAASVPKREGMLS